MYLKVIKMVYFMLHTFITIKYVLKHRLETLELHDFAEEWYRISQKFEFPFTRSNYNRSKIAAQVIRITSQRRDRPVLKLHVVGMCIES